MRIFFGAVFALLVSTGVPASAQTTDTITVDELELALTQAGLEPKMSEDAVTRAPVVFAKLGEISFNIRARDCDGPPVACGTLVFFVNFDLDRQLVHSDYRVINSFNEKQVFGRAYIVENTNQVGVDYVIELEGGVTKDHVARNVSRWSDVVAAFLDRLGAGQANS